MLLCRNTTAVTIVRCQHLQSGTGSTICCDGLLRRYYSAGRGVSRQRTAKKQTASTTGSRQNLAWLLVDSLMVLPTALAEILPSLCQLRSDCCTGWAQQGVVCDACLNHCGHASYAKALRCVQCAQVLHTAAQTLSKGKAKTDCGSTVGQASGPSRQWRCGHCLRLRPALHSCHAAVSYAGAWRQVMARFKPECPPSRQAAQPKGEPALAELAAQLMLTSPEIRSAVAQADVLLPIPSHRQRVAARGFAPAADIARSLRRQARSSAPVIHNALRLRKTVQDQRRLTRRERFANMQNAFAVTAAIRKCTGRHVVLVDDVITTGATLFAAAQALQASEPASVRAVVWARTPS